MITKLIKKQYAQSSGRGHKQVHIEKEKRLEHSTLSKKKFCLKYLPLRDLATHRQPRGIRVL